MGKVHRKLLIGRVKMLLQRNCDITIDEHEIDLSLSISENYYILKDKYTYIIPIHELEDL